MWGEDTSSWPLPPSGSQSDLPELSSRPSHKVRHKPHCFSHRNMGVKCTQHEGWEGAHWCFRWCFWKLLILWQRSFWEKYVGFDKALGKSTLVRDKIFDELEEETWPSCTRSEGNTKLIGLFWYSCEPGRFKLRCLICWWSWRASSPFSDCEENPCPGPEEPSQ